MSPLLDVDDLRVTFRTPTGPVHAVRGVDLTVRRGEILGVVGESGCGKSAALRALLGLSPRSATVTGNVTFTDADGREHRGAPSDTSASLRPEAAMIYQNPGAALNPVVTIGRQLALAAGTRDRDHLTDLLAQAGLDDASALDAHPHEFSGGMRQRAVIALALAQQPTLLVADEPTTALDVTTQAQILDLLAGLRDDQHRSVVFVSHDLGVVRRLADRIAVLYAGRVVETGPTAEVLASPLHPYTRALIASMPSAARLGGDLATIPGQVPDGGREIVGCAFAPRCPLATDACRADTPPTIQHTTGRTVACVHVEPGS